MASITYNPCLNTLGTLCTLVNIWSFCPPPYPHSQRIIDVRSPLWSLVNVDSSNLALEDRGGLQNWQLSFGQVFQGLLAFLPLDTNITLTNTINARLFLGFWGKCGPQHTSLSLTSPTHPSQVRSISSLELAWSHLHESWAVWMRW